MNLNIDLHTNQNKVRKDKSRFRVLVAGRRFGKTTLAIEELIEHALQSSHPCWYVAPTYKQAKMIAWEMLISKLPNDLILSKNEVDLEIKLIVGSKICLKGADNEDSLRGVGLSFVVLDEYAMMKSNVWQEIIRPMLTDTRGKALFIGTPKGKNALYELYVKGQKKEDGFSSYVFKTVDNPLIDWFEVEEARKQTSRVYFRQEYEASFEGIHGLIWDEYDPSKHREFPIDIPDVWRKGFVLDHGFKNPTAVIWWAIDNDGVIHIYDEYYQVEKPISYHAEEIKKRGMTVGIADPSIFSKTQSKGQTIYSIADEYREYGIVLTPAKRQEEMAALNKVNEWFKAGKIQIFKSCDKLHNEICQWEWKPNKDLNKNSPEEPIDKDNHGCDCLKYLCSTMFPERNVEPEQETSQFCVGKQVEEAFEHNKEKVFA